MMLLMSEEQKIVPHLWYDQDAKEAAEFYTRVFQGGSKVTSVSTLRDTPSGDTDVVSFEIWGYKFMAISAGPVFKFNPAMSFMINFDPSQDKGARQRLDEVWEELAKEGKVLMPLQKYDFSEHYGWVEDRYGLSWQLILTNPEGEERPRVIPALMFTGERAGQAEAATDFYLAVFKDAGRGAIARYPAGMEPEKEGTIMFTDFKLEGQWFVAMDSAREHGFGFNEAVSLMIYGHDQAEIDYYWERLSAVPEAEQCGWLKDKYGVSWQVVPRQMDEMMSRGTSEQRERLTRAFLEMKKLDLAELERAYRGE